MKNKVMKKVLMIMLSSTILMGSASVTAFAQANENAEQTEAVEQVIEEQPAEQPAETPAEQPAATETPQPETPAEGGSTETPAVSLPTQEQVEQTAGSLYSAASTVLDAILGGSGN